MIPFDRHALRLVEIHPGQGFDEASTSWLQRRWRHVRRVMPESGGTRVTDIVTVEPRLGLLGPLVRVFVQAVFAHRHRRLRRRFGGGAAAGPAPGR